MGRRSRQKGEFNGPTGWRGIEQQELSSHVDPRRGHAAPVKLLEATGSQLSRRQL